MSITKLCDYCGKPAVYTDSSLVYGKSYGMIYYCPPSQRPSRKRGHPMLTATDVLIILGCLLLYDTIKWYWREWNREKNKNRKDRNHD